MFFNVLINLFFTIIFEGINGLKAKKCYYRRKFKFVYHRLTKTGVQRANKRKVFAHRREAAGEGGGSEVSHFCQ